MYEERKIIINWKSVIIKFLILILILIGILYFYKIKHNSNVDGIIDSNIIKLKDTALDYYSNDNIINSKLNERVSLKELINEDRISKLYLDKNTKCDEENSYIKLVPSGNQYEIEVYLKCGDNTKMLNAYKAKKVISTTTTTTKTTKKNVVYNNNSKTTTKQQYYTSIVTTEKKWAVIYHTNGVGKINTQYLKNGEKIIVPVDPIKDGYIFAGWYSDEHLTKLFDFNISINENIVLYAKWIKA